MFKLESITKTFLPGTPRELNILDNVNIEIKKGEFVVLLGNNGSGKSTLLKIISGDLQPDSGKIFLNGNKLNDVPKYKRSDFISHIKQSREENLPSSLSVLEAFMLAINKNKPSYHILKKLKFEKQVVEMLRSVRRGLENRVKERIEALSGGEHQIITILIYAEMVRKSSLNANLLLLDEHVAHLDPNTSKAVMSFTADFVKRYGLTTLMVTHNIQIASLYGDRVLVLKDKKIVFDKVFGKGIPRSTEDLLHLISPYD